MCISNVFFSDKKDLLISLAALHPPYQKLNWVHFGFLNKKTDSATRHETATNLY